MQTRDPSMGVKTVFRSLCREKAGNSLWLYALESGAAGGWLRLNWCIVVFL